MKDVARDELWPGQLEVLTGIEDRWMCGQPAYVMLGLRGGKTTIVAHLAQFFGTTVVMDTGFQAACCLRDRVSTTTAKRLILFSYASLERACTAVEQMPSSRRSRALVVMKNAYHGAPRDVLIDNAERLARLGARAGDRIAARASNHS